MRCPKCQYISFDSGDRCRNCGYEFSLSIDTGALDLPIQTGEEPEGPLSDLSLDDLDDEASAHNGDSTGAVAPSIPDPVQPRPITSSFDLPLFRDRARDDDRPLVSAPSVPRPPLSVRKTAPVAPRPLPRRDNAEELRLDLSLPEQSASGGNEFLPRTLQTERRAEVQAAPAEGMPAPAGARLGAALVDALVLGAIDLAVLHFTLRIVRLDYSDVALLPLAPFITFLLILNGGYFTAFTAAGGQSIGKMAAGIKVVPEDPDAWTDRIPLGQAVLRSASYLASALPLGMGFLPALIGAEKRSLHDRLAHTRVVKV